MANDGETRLDLSFGDAQKPAPHDAPADSDAAPVARAPAPHGATSEHGDAIARAYKKAKRGGRGLQEITPRPVTAAEAVTSTRIVGTVLNDLTFKLADRESHYHYQKGYHQYYSKERKR